MNCDLIIRNAKIYDGSGSPAFTGDVGVRDGKIVFVGCAGEAEAEKTADAAGLALCPGLVDAHAHSDLFLANPQGALSRLSQGVTTELGGQCGISLFPVNADRLEATKHLIALNNNLFPEELTEFSEFSRCRRFFDRADMFTNLYTFIGHGSLRLAVIGEEDRPATAQEMEKMKDLLRQGMEGGALGLSSGLVYLPGRFASTEEIVELCKVAAEYGGIYTTHMRNEAAGMLTALDEAIEIARRAQISLNISHIKLMGRANWGQSEAALEKIRKAREEGLTVTMDLYPYEATSTTLDSVIPRSFFAQGAAKLLKKLPDPAFRAEVKAATTDPVLGKGCTYQLCGGFEGILLPDTPYGAGLSVAEVARRAGRDPFDTFFDHYAAREGHGTGIYFCIGAEDMDRFLKDERCFIGSDNLFGHPRAFGSFPEAIGRFVRDRKVLPMEQMLRKMTSAPAERYGLTGKGRIAEGADADLVLFDEEKLKAKASFTEPDGLTEGIVCVWIGGKEAYKGGKVEKTPAGRYCEQTGKGR